MKKIFKKITTFILAAVMVFSCCGITAMAASDEDVHGTISITPSLEADDSNTIEMETGSTMTITVSPYMHRQYTGCGMSQCPESCEEYGAKCFVVGYGCSCDTTPITRTAEVTVTVSDSSIISCDGTVTAESGSISTVGSTLDGTLTVSAVAEGTATITITASLLDWVSASETYTIVVGDTSSGEYTETVDTSALAAEYALSEDIDEDDYTEDSYSTYYALLTEAAAVLADSSGYSQSAIDTLTLNLTNARLALVAVVTGDTPEQDSDGYYLLTDADDLVWFSDTVNAGSTDINARLAADISLSGVTWTPIGLSETNLYTGTFDGQGYTISSLTMSATSSSDERYGGLFANLNGTLENVILSSGNIYSSSLAAGLVGRAYPDSVVMNCAVLKTVYVSGKAMYGGLVGNGQGLIINCCSNSPAGLVGVLSGSMYNCFYYGNTDEPYTTTDGAVTKNIFAYCRGTDEYDLTGKYTYYDATDGTIRELLNSYVRSQSDYDLCEWDDSGDKDTPFLVF